VCVCVCVQGEEAPAVQLVMKEARESNDKSNSV
jgi:hypothetical protein